MDREAATSAEPVHDPCPDVSAASLLDAGELPVVGLARIGLREGQSSLPIYRVHRWFARRLASQFRALLTAATLPASASFADFWKAFEGSPNLSGKTILDPFMGGGTSLVEAARTGADVVGYEIDPVAATISRFELDAKEITPAIGDWHQLLDDLSGFFQEHHTTLVDGAAYPVLYHFWVELLECSSCGIEFELHPNFQLAFEVSKKRQWGHCSSCNAIHELPMSRKTLSCSCGAKTSLAGGNYHRGHCVCPSCGHSEPHALLGRAAPRYRLFAQEYLVGSGKKRRREFKAASDDDFQRYRLATEMLGRFENEFGTVGPARPIPTAGRSGARPLVNGITNYRQFFNDRQRLHLGVLAKRISAETDQSLKKVLELAFSEHLTTNSMYTSYAAGYRRTSAMFAMHGFRHIVRPVEANPWIAGEGRGTFPNVVSKLLRALDYAHAPYFFVRDGLSDPRQSVSNPVPTFEVHNKSSELMPEVVSASIDLVLTDPPYFDNVSYSELSDFYLAWSQYLGSAPLGYKDPALCAPMEASLAVATGNAISRSKFAERLMSVFREARRGLKDDGRLVFTYHHSSSEAWSLLAEAISSAGFVSVRTFPMRGEGQGGLHDYEGTIRWDAVLILKKHAVCRKSVSIGSTAIAEARQSALYWWTKLAKEKTVGYRLPDARNFLRALLISHATAALRNEPEDRIELEVALDAAGSWEPKHGKAQQKRRRPHL